MSVFIDKLSRLSRGESQPIGFRAKQAASAKPKIQMVASLAQESAGDLTGHIAGADAVIVRISKPGMDAESLQSLSKALPDIPWGAHLQGSSQASIKQITRAGCDFIVFPTTDTPLTAIDNDEMGKILEVEASLNEGLLRAVNELPIDAVLITIDQNETPSLTWHNLMLFQRFADLLTKPLLVSVTVKVTAKELQSLWGAGVTGVVIALDAKQPEGRLEKLRAETEKLDFSPPQRREKPEAVLPRPGGEPRRARTEEEEEEEE
ncbi:hypothetical protein ACFLW0_01640 [Chloroflexota bacterium]